MKRKPYHISLSQIVRGQLAVMAKARPETSSVELTRNAKGDTQIKVSVSRENSETVEATAARCVAVYDELRKKYPIG